MNRKLAAALGALTLVFAPMTWATNIDDLSKGLDTFVSDGTRSLPFAASAGIDWSDAYIGSIVGVPPHFGLGIVAGATTIPGASVKPLVSALGGSLPLSDLPLPLAGVNARIGGLMLPFDVGLKVGVLPEMKISDYTVSYQNYGLDVRYAVLNGEPLLPAISVGAGVDYFATKVAMTYGSGVSYTHNSDTLTASAPTVAMDLSSLVFSAKAQVSKSLLILTPYLGVQALAGSATAKAGVTSTLTSSTGSLSDWNAYLPGVTSAGFSKSNSVVNFGLKVYGGTSINVFLVRFDLQGMYSILDGSYGATIGTRFQL